MQILVDIDDNLYTRLFNNDKTNAMDMLKACVAIRKGVLLPKVQGRLMILSENRLKENQIDLDFSCQKWISEVGLSNATVKTIKADTTESEE